MPLQVPFLLCSKIVSPFTSARKPISFPRHKHCVVSIAHSFEAAVAKGYVFNFGRVVQLDAHAQAVPSTDLRIPSKYHEVFCDILNLILSLAHVQTVRGVFVRGSIVTGSFFHNGDSDLDLIILTEKEVSRATKTKLKTKIQHAMAKHFEVSSVDIYYEQGQPKKFGKVVFNFSPSLSTILRHYAVPLYGSLKDVDVPMGHLTPCLEIAKDIREEERRFQLAIDEGSRKSDFNLQRIALQWLCKRCLRAVADLCSRETLFHSRDLVPCFRAVSTRFPQFEQTFLVALQIACASKTNNYVNLSQEMFLNTGILAVRGAVEIVEDIYLKHHFPKRHEDHEYNQLSTHFNPRSTFLQTAMMDDVMIKLAYARRVFVKLVIRDKDVIGPFFTSELPPLADKLGRGKYNIQHDCNIDQNDLSMLLKHVSQPTLIRKTVLLAQVELFDSYRILENLMKSHISVDCRISPNNIVTFCRSKHQFLANSSFTPPSVLRRLNPRDALHRMTADCVLHPLVYENCRREHLYIQTRTRTSEQLFPKAENTVQVAQHERLWLSTDGTVSSLHYDASHSALFQRTGKKRMILFPREALPSLGVYPLGHPLHRRARVNLSYSNTPLFEDFWTNWASKAVEVWIEPGDLLLFPPFWAHYTESITTSEKELCCSHIIRYW